MDVQEHAQVFSALGADTRLQIIQFLEDKELSCEDPNSCDITERCCDVSELTDALGISTPSVSHHLKELRRAGLIQTEKRGRRVYCSINRERMRDLEDFFASFHE